MQQRVIGDRVLFRVWCIYAASLLIAHVQPPTSYSLITIGLGSIKPSNVIELSIPHILVSLPQNTYIMKRSVGIAALP